MLPVIPSKRAEEDLINIWLRIGCDNPDAADRLLSAFERRWRQLAQYPYSGIARDDIAPGIRHLVTHDYLTLYKITDTAIEIVRVLHGRRNIMSDEAG